MDSKTFSLIFMVLCLASSLSHGGHPSHQQCQDGHHCKKKMVFSMLVKQNLAKNSGTLSGAEVSLHCSKLSHIYISSPPGWTPSSSTSAPPDRLQEYHLGHHGQEEHHAGVLRLHLDSDHTHQEQPHHDVPHHQASLLHPPPLRVDTFCPPFSSYLATPFILLPMKYEMAVRGKQAACEIVGGEDVKACLTSKALQGG